MFCISRNARPVFNRSVLGGGWAAVSGSCDSDAEQLVSLSRSPVGRSLRRRCGWSGIRSYRCAAHVGQLVSLSRSPVGRSLRSTRTKRQRVAGLRAGRLRPARLQEPPANNPIIPALLCVALPPGNSAARNNEPSGGVRPPREKRQACCAGQSLYLSRTIQRVASFPNGTKKSGLRPNR